MMYKSVCCYCLKESEEAWVPDHVIIEWVCEDCAKERGIIGGETSHE